MKTPLLDRLIAAALRRGDITAARVWLVLRDRTVR